MTMLEITGICLSRTISVNILGYLKSLVMAHLQLFKDVFNKNITPKQHCLVHLPGQILKFGPLIRLWAMRFEGKHQQFKNISKIIESFKNLPKTLTNRHQDEVRADLISLSNANDQSDHPLFRKDVSLHKGGNARKLSGVERDDAIAYISRFYPSFSELTDDIFTAT